MRSFNKEALKIFNEKVKDVGDWFRFDGDSDTICLDGWYSLEELKRVVSALEEYFKSVEEET